MQEKKFNNYSKNFTKTFNNATMEVINKSKDRINDMSTLQKENKYPSINGNFNNVNVNEHKIPTEKLEVERLQRLIGEHNLKKVHPKVLQDSIKLKNKTSDDYY